MKRLATKPPAAVPVPPSIEVRPAEVSLGGAREMRQIVVTGYFGGEPRDLTAGAVYRTSNPKVAGVSGGRVTAAGDGQATVVVLAGGKSVRVPVRVAGRARPDPVKFKFETLAVLTKQGCASGSCHGSPHGKGGFSLSLFGYDPQIDRVSLTRDGFNRRLNVLEPEESLVLKKPLLEVSHGGGRKLKKGATPYRVLRNWIYEGAVVDLPEVECDRIEILPREGRVLRAPFLKQQISVLAHFTDGTTRDVTPIATYESSHPSVASVDADGLVTGSSRGQAAVSVRYLDRLESVYLTVVEDVPGFAWKPASENNWIDRLVHDKLRQLQYLPSGTCTDEEFVRRLYLDLTGQLPAPERTRAFLADSSPDKRAQLVDALLETEEYARFWALKKADLMRVSPRRLKDGRAERFAAWLTDAVRKNVPYDRFARELLTAAGDTAAVATANYFLAIPSMEERTEMTAQIFMGSRLECARCHNHPFESWTMRDYYSIAAVFARTSVVDGTVKLASAGEALHPTTKQPMKPWGAAEEEAADRRTAFAEWLTRPGNPYFAPVEANRIWANLLGRGIVEPVDDFRSSNPPANGPLLDALARELEKSGFDRKHLIRLICNSRAYQRSTATNRFNESDTALFSHARIRLLTAEQLKDAIGVVTRSLEPAPEIPSRLADLEKQAHARAAELDRTYEAWLEKQAARVGSSPYWVGGWYLSRPYKVPDMQKGLAQPLPPEQGPVDLAAAVDGKPVWTLRTDFEDGRAYGLTDGYNLVHYLYRRIHASEARKVTVRALGKDSALAWLNGRPLTQQPFRGDQRLELELQPGENHFLLKVANGDPVGAHRFTVVEPDSGLRDLPPHVVEYLAVPSERRTGAQQRTVREHYLHLDDRYRGLRQRIARLESRSDYATQRAYPEPTPLTTAFGQPQRETACTCERQTSPTLLQALELLNGGAAHQAAVAAADRYAELPDPELVEELYLAAYSRRPKPRERETALKYLTRGGDRKQAVADLVWTVLSTQEFLFQH